MCYCTPSIRTPFCGSPACVEAAKGFKEKEPQTDFKLHVMKKEGFCRGCDKTLEKDEEVVYNYTRRNKGHHIYICKECVSAIFKILY